MGPVQYVETLQEQLVDLQNQTGVKRCACCVQSTPLCLCIPGQLTISVRYLKRATALVPLSTIAFTRLLYYTSVFAGRNIV